MVSLATAIVPSPDWFLGVANLELCKAKAHEWAKSVTFNLYPMDAGTDSGKKFDVRKPSLDLKSLCEFCDRVFANCHLANFVGT